MQNSDHKIKLKYTASMQLILIPDFKSKDYKSCSLQTNSAPFLSREEDMSNMFPLQIAGVKTLNYLCFCKNLSKWLGQCKIKHRVRPGLGFREHRGTQIACGINSFPVDSAFQWQGWAHPTQRCQGAKTSKNVQHVQS